MVKDKKWVLLNVGGTYFMTSRATLTRSTPSNSPLHRISSNSTNVDFDRDERGAYIIDRDPAYFQVILNYLRHGHLLLNRDTTEEGVLIEADYFNLPELRQRLLNNRLFSYSQPIGTERKTIMECMSRMSTMNLPPYNQ